MRIDGPEVPRRPKLLAGCREIAVPEGRRLFLSSHAMQRCREMGGLTRADVVGAVQNAEVTYPSRGRQLYAGGAIVVVVAEESAVVVTVLPRTEEFYERETLDFLAAGPVGSIAA